MRKFKRNKKIALADQANNPGALNVGRWSRRYGHVAEYTYQGNTTAVFATRGHGIAALMELILDKLDYYGNVSVREYITGGDTIPASKSYSGGQKHYADSYLAAMRQKRVNVDGPLTGSIRQLKLLVNAHAFAEGAKRKNTPNDFNIAIALLLERSPNLAKSELSKYTTLA